MERFQDKPASQRESSDLVGPYVILAEIARGDLTTVYLAKKHGALGFQRLYALKRLKPAAALNADSVELLLDEARLVSGIHHANIAGVLDVGTDAGSYVVMDYVEGENLEVLLARAGKTRLPRFIVPVFVDVLNGLHALHTASDADGETYAIVHQAPRARHIVVGVDGTTRLVDFSQVRGRNVRPTRARSDRIKVAYMAPEQALHPDGVDLRSDVFIAGVALWEALTGERLFAAGSDEQTFQNMLHRRIPRPSEVGLRPPRCFDAICMRALERDPKSRYPSAQEMARDLHDTAINQALYATTSEVGQWVRQLAGADLRQLRKLAGQDAPSSGGISLETPSAGMDLSGYARQQPGGSGLARLSDGLVVALSRTNESAERSDENPYASGRIYGGAERPALEVLPEAELTPAVGFRRDRPLPREEEDDDPTGPRPLPGAFTSRAVHDERARAATVPLASPAAVSVAATVVATDAVARGEVDSEETNPSVFVPARPGARRDVNRASPGSYSQVNSPRQKSAGRAPSTELEIPNAKLLLTKDSPAFEEADTTLRPQLAPAAEEGQAKPRSETKSYEAASRSGAERRSAAITETAPIYVQRRDSNPTRMEIPAGPVGTPHRPFTPERLPAPATRALQASNHPFDMPVAEGASAPRSAAVLPDSLTPPASATRTAPPDLPPAARPSALWLVSGVLAAIILLALGVGLKQWVAGGPPASSSHAATGRPRTPYEETLRADPASGQTAPAAPQEPASPTGGASAASPSALPSQLGPMPATNTKLPSAIESPARVEPKAVRPATTLKRPVALRPARPAGAPEPRRERAADLPDNPY